jgi:uncharacterized membrane protein HdeD (DUF308 family)
MPILLLIVGILLIVVGINDKVSELGDLITEDFQPSDGSAGFHIWIVAIFVAGAIGYIPGFKPVANAFLVLIVLGILLSNKGFFSQFTDAIESV